ncbi:hypothetical protein J6590_020385 [Homalodisca vitripennis]|nr:hypothetical protein J6590_020385 [Homalodisca vitripennis]
MKICMSGRQYGRRTGTATPSIGANITPACPRPCPTIISIVNSYISLAVFQRARVMLLCRPPMTAPITLLISTFGRSQPFMIGMANTRKGFFSCVANIRTTVESSPFIFRRGVARRSMEIIACDSAVWQRLYEWQRLYRVTADQVVSQVSDQRNALTDQLM